MYIFPILSYLAFYLNGFSTLELKEKMVNSVCKKKQSILSYEVFSQKDNELGFILKLQIVFESKCVYVCFTLQTYPMTVSYCKICYVIFRVET